MKWHTNNHRAALFAAALVLLISLVTFMGVLQADFVMWDDDTNIYLNPNLGPLSLESIKWAFTDVALTMRFQPISLLGWSALFTFFGLKPFGFHLANWWLHGLNATALFFVVRNLLLAHGKRVSMSEVDDRGFIDIAAGSAALLWAVNPLRVEPVAWVTGFTYCLAVFFILMSVLVYQQALVMGVGTTERRFAISLSVIFYCCSLMSQVIGVTFFAVFVVMDVYLYHPIGDDKTGGGWNLIAGLLRRHLVFIVPSVLFLAVNVIARATSHGDWPAPPTLAEFGLLDRFMQASYLLFHLTFKQFYPTNLAPIYAVLISFDPLSFPFLFRAVCVSAALTAVWFFRKQWELFTAFLIAYLMLLLPVLGLLEHPYFPSDRYTYLPALSLSALLAFTIMLAKRKSANQVLVVLPLAVIILVSAGLSSKQVKVWYNSETLFNHTIRTLGDDPLRLQIIGRLATYYQLHGHSGKAIEALQEILAIKPASQKANSELAAIYCSLGQYSAAVPLYRLMLSQEPNNARTHYCLGTALQNSGRQHEAAEEFKCCNQLKNNR